MLRNETALIGGIVKTLKGVCLGFAMAGVICLAACEKDSPEMEKPQTVRIGAVYPFTGHSGAAGEDSKAGIRLAAEIINGSFDLPLPLAGSQGLPSLGGAPVEIIFRDSRSDSKTAVELIDQLVHEERAIALMGCYNSAVTATASEEAEVLKIPFLNPDSTSPVLTQRGLQWFFRTTPDDAMFAGNFFSFLAELSESGRINVPNRLLLVYENRLWGTGVARAERKLARKHDYQIVGDVTYDAGAEECDEELRRIGSSMPAVILQSSYARDAVLFMRGYKRQQINPVAILAMNAGFISPTFLESLGPDGEYIFSREVWALDTGNKKPLVTAVNDLFKERFGRNMTGNSARAFTGLIVLANAVNGAASLEAVKIREALLRTDMTGDNLIMPWDGVRFDAKTGQNALGKGLIVQVQQGQYVTVWPHELSTRPVLWPMPSWAERTGKK